MAGGLFSINKAGFGLTGIRDDENIEYNDRIKTNKIISRLQTSLLPKSIFTVYI